MNRPAILAALLFFAVNIGRDADFAGPLLAQDDVANSDESGAEAAPKAVAPKAAGESGPRATSVVVGSGAAARHVPGKWSTLNVNVQNNTNEDSQETAIVTFGEDSSLQYARKVWVPAGARRTSWMPVKIPEDLSPSDPLLPMTSIHLKETESGEQFQADVTGMSTTSGSVMLSWSDFRTGTILGDRPTTKEEAIEFDKIREAIYLGSDSVAADDPGQGVVEFSSKLVSPSPRGMDSLDQMIIASDDFFTDSGSVSRLQGWLQNGGMIWIMADRVSPESARRLLGDVAAYHVVDRVELNEFEFQGIAKHVSVKAPKPEPWSSEEPVELVRVVIDGQQVLYSIDGWPAAFWANVGKGQVLITTLEASGWTKDQEPTLAYQDLAQQFFIRREQMVSATDPMLPFLDKEIGYKIPRRGQIATTLGLYSLALLIIGIVLAKRRSLQQMAWVVPVATLCAAGFLFYLGSRQTGSVPSTIATGQLAVIDPQTATAQVSSVSAVYSQESRTLALQSPSSTLTEVRQAGSSGQVRRIVWEDDGGSRWDHLKQPPGVVRHIESEATIQLSQPWAIQGTFTKDGFQGSILGGPEADAGEQNASASRYEDAIVLGTGFPSLALKPGANDQFQGGVDALMAEGQFIADDFMTDLQRSRQALVRELSTASPPLIPSDRRMLVWTDPIDVGVQFDDDFQRRGSALTLLPIQLKAVPTGQDFVVPATFVDLKQRAGSGAGRIIYDDRVGKWLDGLNEPIEVEMLCRVPDVALPAKLTRATAQVRVNAPSRTLRLHTLVDGQRKSVFERANPNGAIEFAIEQDNLQADASGDVHLIVSISDSSGEVVADNGLTVVTDELFGAAETNSIDQQPDRSTWQIEYLRINFEGTAL